MSKPIPIGITSDAVSGATLFANRRDALAMWPKNSKVAELGVGFGGYTAEILSTVKPLQFDAYDLFNLHEIPMLWGKPSSEIFSGKTQREYYENKFKDAFSSGVLTAYPGDSSTQLSSRAPATYDVIYIDGDHTIKGAARDTLAAVRAIKSNGILVFNDYVVYDKAGEMYGVVHAVNDLCVNQGWRVLYLALQAEMFCDIALVRR